MSNSTTKINIDKKNDHNLYDFDHTIYRGDSTIDLYVYSLIHNLNIAKYLPFQIYHFVLYILGIEEKKIFKGNFLIFIKDIKDLDILINNFWSKNSKKIKSWYIQQKNKNDIIISASPDFLLKTIATQLGCSALIATRVDIKTGKIIGENCYGQEKIHRLDLELPNANILSCYSDSYSDTPILKRSKKAFFVKGDKITRIKV